MTNPKPAGFVIFDTVAIFGVGETEDAAWADLRNEMRLARVPHESEVDTEDNYCPPYWSEDRFTIMPATAALLAQVDGGKVDEWDEVGGIACVRDEDA